MSATIDPMACLRTAALAALLVAGCSTPAVTPRPTIVATSTPIPVQPTLPTDTPVQTIQAGQVDTAWGPIWETLPEGFPVPPGAQDAEAETTVSAAYTVPTSSLPDARRVVGFYGQEFSSVGYGGGVDGPFEDGSYSAWASNGYGCDMMVEAVPRGSEETYVTVLYGALCPFAWES